MRRSFLAPALMFAVVLTAIGSAAQEDKSKRPSPPGTADVTLNGKKVTIEYSRPFLKGRKIGEEIVPYGKVWRTGANEATTLTTETALDIAGVSVPAGKYTVFTLPTADNWKLIINKQTGQSGLDYDQAQDLARVDMQKSQLPQPVEQFTISFDKKSESAADLVLQWGTVRVSAPVKAR
jgi:Protein of unknown function (DUF2911)